MTDPKDILAVEQVDRDRAASLEPNGRERDQILRGKRNHSPAVQAFARHRLAALASASPAVGDDEVERLRAVIERDRASVCVATNDLRARFASYAHLREFGRGSYAWNDDRYQQEFGLALDHFEAGLAPLNGIAKDWSDCPSDPQKIAEARAALRPIRPGEGLGLDLVARHESRADAAEAEADRLRNFLSVGSYQMLQSEQAWRQRALEAEQKLATLPSAVEGWQGIESAPRGQLIDIWITTAGGHRVSDCYYDNICGEWRTSRPSGHLVCIKERWVSHWQPLPAPPAKDPGEVR